MTKMDDLKAIDRDRVFLTDREACAFLDGYNIPLSYRTLAQWRVEGYGPSYHKFGRLVRYTPTDLLDWALAQRREIILKAIDGMAERAAARAAGQMDLPLAGEVDDQGDGTRIKLTGAVGGFQND